MQHEWQKLMVEAAQCVLRVSCMCRTAVSAGPNVSSWSTQGPNYWRGRMKRPWPC